MPSSPGRGLNSLSGGPRSSAVADERLTEAPAAGTSPQFAELAGPRFGFGFAMIGPNWPAAAAKRCTRLLRTFGWKAPPSNGPDPGTGECPNRPRRSASPGGFAGVTSATRPPNPGEPCSARQIDALRQSPPVGCEHPPPNENGACCGRGGRPGNGHRLISIYFAIGCVVNLLWSFALDRADDIDTLLCCKGRAASRHSPGWAQAGAKR